MQQLTESILSLHKEGKSRKVIARTLGITEWKVRTVVRANITRDIVISEKEQKIDCDLRLANVSKKRCKATRTIILNDIHIPYHDQKSLAIALAYMADNPPDQIILNGDIIDCYSVSSYRKDPARLMTFQDEINETKEFLRYLRETFKKAKIYYTIGNHEKRIEKQVMDKLGDFASLDDMAIEDKLELSKFDIIAIDDHSTIDIGDLEVFHGNIVRKDSGASAKAHHMKTGGSLLIGHVHRLGTFYKTNKWGTHVAIENGYLARDDFEYTNRPDWQQGFTEVMHVEGTNDFSFRQHPILNHRLVVDGVIYE